MISPFPPQISGGSKASYYFYRYLSKECNHQIEVLTYQKFQNKHVNVYSVALKGQESIFRGIFFILLGFLKGLFLAKKFKPDILYSKQLMSPSITAYFISKALRIPLISHTAGPDIQSIEFMSSNVPSFFSKIYYYVFSWLRLQVLKYSSAIICNCKADFVALQELYKNNKSIIIYNGLNLNKFKFKQRARHDIRDKYNIKDNETVVRYTGQANKQKQTDKLLEITKINNKFKFFIVGPKVEELLNFGVINENVFVPGPIYSNIEDYLSAADIFILPSKHEGLSNSLLEALSVGLPVIVTPVGEAKYIIEHKKNGILSKVENFPAWLEKLDKNDILRNNIKNRTRKMVENKFNWSQNARKISKLFKRVILMQQ